MIYRYSITINKCKDKCNNINNPCVKLCVKLCDTIKNINVKVFQEPMK